MKKINSSLLVALSVGFILGGAAGFLAGFIPYYRHYWVDLGGPAGSVAVRFSDSVNRIQDPIQHRSRSAEDVMAHQLIATGGEAILAAEMYCSMNAGGRSATRTAAANLAANKDFQSYVGDPRRNDIRASLTYLVDARNGAGQCVPFHSVAAVD